VAIAHTAGNERAHILLTMHRLIEGTAKQASQRRAGSMKVRPLVSTAGARIMLTHYGEGVDNNCDDAVSEATELLANSAKGRCCEEEMVVVGQVLTDWKRSPSPLYILILVNLILILVCYWLKIE
jgi:hypothetical protein